MSFLILTFERYFTEIYKRLIAFFFSFQHLMLFHCLLASIIFNENSADLRP